MDNKCRLQLHQLMHNCAKWKKWLILHNLSQKDTHISGCKIVHLFTIATVNVHIYTVTVACAFNILLVFSLSCLCSHSHSLLVSALTSPHSPFVSAKFACGYRAKLVFAGSESGGFDVGIFVVKDKAFIFYLFFFFHKPIFVRQVK